MSKIPKWCKHIRHHFVDRSYFEKVLISEEIYWLLENEIEVEGNWQFCPICSKPRPKEKK